MKICSNCGYHNAADAARCARCNQSLPDLQPEVLPPSPAAETAPEPAAETAPEPAAETAPEPAPEEHHGLA